MTKVLISYQLPQSLDASELRSWLGDQMRVLSGDSAELLPGSPADPPRDHLLRFALGSDLSRSAEDRIAELLTDMRMLGLQPRLVAVSDARDWGRRRHAESL